MDNIVKSAIRWLLFLLAACMIMYAVFPAHKSIALGLAAGLLVSAMNAFLLKRRIGMIAEAAIQEGARKRGLGFGNRIASVLLLAMIAYQYPDVLNLPAALAGSMVMSFLLLAAGIVQTMQENKNGKG